MQILRNISGRSSLYAIQNGDLKHVVESSNVSLPRELDLNHLMNLIGPVETNFRGWAYYLDFEKREMEVWRAHDMLDVVGFDVLKELGGDYMRRIQRICDAELEEVGEENYWLAGISGRWKKHDGDTVNK